MPYSTRYVMNELARGRGVPRGDPNRDLFHALAILCPRSVDDALHKGARADARGPDGRSTLHALLDVITAPRGYDAHRALACARNLFRSGALDVMSVCPRTRVTALERASVMASHPLGAAWYDLWSRRGDWKRPQGPHRQPAYVAWKEVAIEPLASRLVSRFPDAPLEPSTPARTGGPSP